MNAQPLVGVVMGSKSDYEVLSAAVEILRALEIPHEAKIVSAHRTPDWLFQYAETARERGLRVIIAGAGGAAHLPGMLAAKTLVPVLGVPVPATLLNGLDSLLSIVQAVGKKGLLLREGLFGRRSVHRRLRQGKGKDRESQHVGVGCDEPPHNEGCVRSLQPLRIFNRDLTTSRN
jgi:hypothetical protein